MPLFAGTIACYDASTTAPPKGPIKTDWMWAVEAEGWNTPGSDSTQAYFVSLRHEVFAINRLSGVVNWKVRLPEPGSETQGGTIGVSHGVVIAGDWDVYGLDGRTGVIRWKFTPTDGYAPGLFDITVESDTVYLGSPSGVIYAMNPTTGIPYWQTRVFASDNPTSIYHPSADGGIVLAPFTTFAKVKPDTGGVVALDRATGAIKWITHYPHRYAASFTDGLSLGVSNGIAISTSEDGVVYAQKANTGEIVWTAPAIPDNIFTVSSDIRPVAVAGQRAFVGSSSGFVSAYAVPSGALLWRTQLGHGSTNFRITADETNVYITDSSGGLSILRVETGVRVFFESRYPVVNFANAAWPDGNQIFQAAAEGFYAFKKP